jgi:hypothetical protein
MRRLLVLIIVIATLAGQIGLLFLPRGVMYHTIKVITTGCDKDITYGEYQYLSTGNVFEREFCGEPPSSLDTVSSLVSDRSFMIFVGWLFIVGSIIFTFVSGFQAIKIPRINGDIITYIFLVGFLYVFGLLFILL